MVSQEDIERLRELLARPAQNIVIVSHTNPDGDAVGSSLAWREALLEMGHRVTCIVPNKYPYFLDWMTGIENLVLFKTDEAGVARRAVEESDLIFFLDFNAVSRLEGLSEVIESNTTARRILIDHHLSPGPGFDLMFSCTGSSSTSFLIYRILEKMLGTQAITRSMAESLYVGMMTDTGNFSFSFLTPELYRAVAVLVETGIDIPTIHNNVYNAFTEGRARLFGYAINRKMEVIHNGTVAYMSLLESEMRRFQFQPGDSEGFVNYPLTIKSMKLSAIFVATHKFIRVSLRSRGGVDVDLFARKPSQCGRRQVFYDDAGNHRAFQTIRSRVCRPGRFGLGRYGRFPLAGFHYGGQNPQFHQMRRAALHFAARCEQAYRRTRIPL